MEESHRSLKDRMLGIQGYSEHGGGHSGGGGNCCCGGGAVAMSVWPFNRLFNLPVQSTKGYSKIRRRRFTQRNWPDSTPSK